MQGASAAEPDEEGQQYLNRQRHAAAVQLHSRQLAIAFLRGQVKMPRGCTVHIQKAMPHRMNQETALGDKQSVHPRPRDVGAEPLHMIQLHVTSTANDLNLDQQPSTAPPQQAGTGSKHTALRARQLVHKRPDAAAISRFLEDLPAEPLEPDAEQVVAASAAEVLPAPRISADPAHVHQQLAGWTRVAAAGEAGDTAAGEEQGILVEEILGAGVEDVDDMMDEEEWV